MVQARLSRRLNLFFQSFLTQSWLLAHGDKSKRIPRLASALQPAKQNFLRSPIALLARVLTGGGPVYAHGTAPAGIGDYTPGRMHLFAPARNGGLIFKDEAGIPRGLEFVRHAEPSIRLSAAVHRSNRAKQKFWRHDIDDSEPQSVVGRIGQKHRRVEEYRLIERRELHLKRDEMQIPGSTTVLAERPQSRPRARRLALEDEPRSARPAAQPVVDATRITDEVLKQLDRRLVAARERMGKI